MPHAAFRIGVQPFPQPKPPVSNSWLHACAQIEVKASSLSLVIISLADTAVQCVRPTDVYDNNNCYRTSLCGDSVVFQETNYTALTLD